MDLSVIEYEGKFERKVVAVKGIKLSDLERGELMR